MALFAAGSVKEGAARLYDAGSPWARVRLLWAIGVFWAGLYLYIPILTPYVVHQGGSASIAGLVVAAYGVPQLTTRIALGRFADRLGRRRVFLILGMLTVVASSLGMAIWPFPWAFLVFRVVAGLAASTWAMYSMMYVSYLPKNHDAHAMGWVSFANNAGQVVATLAGGFLAARFGWASPFWASAALAVLGLGLVIGLPERPAAPAASREAPSVWTLLRFPTLRAASLLGIATQVITFVTTFGYVPLWAAQHGVPRSELGTLMMAGIVPSTVVSVITGSVLARRIPLIRLAWIGFLVMGVFVVATPLGRGAGWLFFTQAALGIGRGIVSPILMALAIQGVEPRWRTTSLAVYQAVYAVGMIGGPALGALVVGVASLEAVFWVAGAAALAGVLGSVAWREVAGEHARGAA